MKVIRGTKIVAFSIVGCSQAVDNLRALKVYNGILPIPSSTLSNAHSFTQILQIHNLHMPRPLQNCSFLSFTHCFTTFIMRHTSYFSTLSNPIGLYTLLRDFVSTSLRMFQSFPPKPNFILTASWLPVLSATLSSRPSIRS